MGIREEYLEHRLRLDRILIEQLDAFGASIDQDVICKENKLQRCYLNVAEKDARIKSLEVQVQVLKAGSLEASAGVISRDQFDALAYEYERVMKARAILESKCRHYKDMLKEWRQHYKILTEKKRPRSLAPNPELKIQEESDATEAPTPPVPTLNITPMTAKRESELPLSVDKTQTSRSNLSRRLPTSEELSRRTGVDGIPDDVHIHGLEGNSATGAAGDGDDDSRPTTADSSQISNDIRVSHSIADFSRADTKDDDSPVFVSARTIKRKRSSVKTEPEISIHVDQDIKAEAESSSPIITVHSRPTNRAQDSLDLDDVGRLLDTPRKRQRLERMRLLSGYPDGSRQELPPGEPSGMQQSYDAITNRAVKDEPEGMVGRRGFKADENDHHSTISVALFDNSSKDQMKDQPEAMRIAEQAAFNDQVRGSQASNPLEDEIIAAASTSAPTLRHTYARSSKSNDPPVILGPKDPNVLPRTSNRKGRLAASGRRDNGAAYMTDLAEDGDTNISSKDIALTPQVLDRKQTSPSATAIRNTPNAHDRLGILLERPSSANSNFLQCAPNLRLSKAVASPRTPVNSSRGSSVHRAHHEFFTTPVRKPSTVDWPPASTNSRPANSRPSNQTPATGNPPEAHPDHEPLCARPVEHLRLSDFKLNKTHSEYAFHESIRKHDEKRKVGGCTDPFCTRCKEIARFAALTDFIAPAPTTLFGSSTSSSSSPPDAAAAEQAMLLGFLGGGHENKARLDRMTPQERQETLKKAREKSFADLYGRHRQLHNRAVSPPGYWETEFPSTQQEAENREAARAIEKVRVRERWEEALKGGMWKFADE